MRFLFACILFAALVAGCNSSEPQPPKKSAPAATPAPAGASGVVKKWETYHGAPSLDGAADVTLRDQLALLWRYDATGQVYNTPVYGSERIAFADSKGVVHVLGLDGKAVWTKALTEKDSQGREVPALLDPPLLLIESSLIAVSSTGVVNAWNVVDGAEKWRVETGKAALGSPTYATPTLDGQQRRVIYFIDTSSGALQALDFVTGKPLWSGEEVDRCDGSPAANEKYVAYGSCASAVHVFSAADGRLLRQIQIDEDAQVAGGVVLLGDSVFTASRSGKFLHANAATGEVIWSNTDCDGESLSTPAVGEEHIIFSANDAYVYALNRKDGSLLWKKEMDDTPSSAVITHDRAAISADGKLHLMRLSDGEVLWSFPVSDEITSPGVAGDLLVVAGDDGSVSAFAGKTGA